VAELIPQSPWQALAPVGQGAGVVATAVTGRSIATVMARRGQIAALAARVREHFGVELIDAPKRVSGRGVSWLGIGPSKWLAMAEQPGFVAGLVSTLAGVASVVEQSDGLAVLALSGPALPATFEKGFQIDLRAFANDDCAVTSVNHLGATIWKTGDAGFEIAIFRSFAGSFLHWLGASAAIDGLAVTSG